MVDAWDSEQDSLYRQALARLRAAGWDMPTLSRTDQALVALWRLEADMYNGGFLQFLCNWGVPNCQIAIAALAESGASTARDLVQSMYEVVSHYGETDEVVSLSELPGLLSAAERERLSDLERSFFNCADPLSRLVVQHYGSH